MRALQRAVVTLTQWTDKREPDIAKSRKGVDVVEGLFRLASGVTITEETIAGLPARRYSSGGRTPGVVLHLHGGAYYCGTSKMGRCYSRVVADGGPDMVSLDYRLAPEHPYPAALDDALAAYEALLISGPVVVMGDSAGGGLALALVQRLRDEGKRLPVALAPFFPWSDLTQSSESYNRTAGHDMMTKARRGLGRRPLCRRSGCSARREYLRCSGPLSIFLRRSLRWVRPMLCLTRHGK